MMEEEDEDGEDQVGEDEAGEVEAWEPEEVRRTRPLDPREV